MERSVNSDPGSRCLPGPCMAARVGVETVCAGRLSLLALLQAKEAEAD